MGKDPRDGSAGPTCGPQILLSSREERPWDGQGRGPGWAWDGAGGARSRFSLVVIVVVRLVFFSPQTAIFLNAMEAFLYEIIYLVFTSKQMAGHLHIQRNVPVPGGKVSSGFNYRTVTVH